MTNANVTLSGAHPSVPTIFRHRTLRIPTTGAIDASVKVLPKKTADNPIAKEIYEYSVAQGQPFEEIRHAIMQGVPDLYATRGATSDRKAEADRSAPFDGPVNGGIAVGQADFGTGASASIPPLRPTWVKAGDLVTEVIHTKATPSLGEADISEEQVMAAATALGIDASHYAAYAAQRWGAGWKWDANDRRRARDEIHRYRNDPEGLADKIDAVLRACRIGA